MKPSTTQQQNSTGHVMSPMYTKVIKAILENLRRLSQHKQIYTQILTNYDANPTEAVRNLRASNVAVKEQFQSHMLEFTSWYESFPIAVERSGKKNLSTVDISDRLISLQPKIKLTGMHGSYLTYLMITLTKEAGLGIDNQFINAWRDIKIQLRKRKEEQAKKLNQTKTSQPIEPPKTTSQQPPTNLKIDSQNIREKQRRQKQKQQKQRQQKQKAEQLRRQEQQRKLIQQKKQEQQRKQQQKQKLEQQKKQERAEQLKRQEKQEQKRRQEQRQKQRKRQEELKKEKQIQQKQREQTRLLDLQRRQREQHEKQQLQKKKSQMQQQQKKSLQKTNKTKFNQARWKKNKQQRLANIIKYLESRKEFNYGTNQVGVAKEIFHNLERFMKDKMQKILKFSKMRTPGIMSDEMGDQFRLYSNKSTIFYPKHSIMLPQTQLKILKLRYPSKSQRYVRLRIQQQKLEQKLKLELRQKTQGDKKLQKIIQSYIITDQNVQHQFERDEGPLKRKRLTVLSQVIQYVIELDPWFKDLFIMEKTFYKGYINN